MSRQKAFTVAVVGADGSGKSTVARQIVGTDPRRFKYIYMGWAIDSANHALPTTRLLAYWKRRALRDEIGDSALPPAALMSDDMRSKLPAGKLVKLLSFLNRIADEQYRQLIAWLCRMRGYTVIFDRHYLFEYVQDPESHPDGLHRWIEKTHARLTKQLCRAPDLVIFLDAPARTLYERKSEWPIEHLEHQRAKIETEGRSARNFVRIDVSQPVDRVVKQALQQIGELRSVRTADLPQS